MVLTKMKNFLIGAGLTLIGAFGLNQATTPTLDTSAIVAPKPIPVPPSKPIGFPKTFLGKLDINPDEQIMVAKAINNLNLVLQTDCFKKEVLQAQFTETNHLTNEQIYALFTKSPIAVNVALFDGTWKQNVISRTVGYENGDGFVHANRYFVKTANDLASNIIHEALGHGLGFRHDSYKPTSVPYQLNDIYFKCSKFTDVSN